MSHLSSSLMRGNISRIITAYKSSNSIVRSSSSSCSSILHAARWKQPAAFVSSQLRENIDNHYDNHHIPLVRCFTSNTKYNSLLFPVMMHPSVQTKYYHTSTPMLVDNTNTQEAEIIVPQSQHHGDPQPTLTETQQVAMNQAESEYQTSILEHGEVHPESIHKSVRIGDLHWEHSNLSSCLDYYEGALFNLWDYHNVNHHNNDNAVNHPSIAMILHKLGNVHARSGAFMEASKWYDKSLEMKQALLTPSSSSTFEPYPSGNSNSVEVGTTLNSIAMVYAQTNDMESAIRTWEEAEKYTRINTNHDNNNDDDDTEEEDLSDDHPNLISICENMAQCLIGVNEFSKALPNYLEALRVKKVWLHNGEDRRDGHVCDLTRSVGDCYYGGDRYSDALENYEDALGIATLIHKHGHPNDDDVDNNEDSEDETTAAEGGEESPMMALLHHNIGSCHFKMGNLNDALTHFDASLELKQSLMGNDSVDCADTLNCIGAVWASKNDSDRALAFFKEALRIYESNKDVHHDDGMEEVGIVDAKRNIALIEQSRLA